MEHVRSSIISHDTIRGKKKDYTIYYIRISDMETNRSYILKKRYSEFYAMYKEIPNPQVKLPKKKIIGNMTLSHIQKRQHGLDQFLKQVLEKHGEVEGVTTFLELHRLKKGIYCLEDTAIKNIMDFLLFDDIFQRVSLVCWWWRRILFGKFENLSFLFTNHNIFMNKHEIAIDTIDELTSLIQSFYNLKSLSIIGFAGFGDKELIFVQESCPRLKNLYIQQASVSNPVFSIRLEALSIQYCPRFQSLEFIENWNQLTELSFNGLSISDEFIEQVLSRTIELKKLFIKNCSSLRAPKIDLPHLHTLNFNHSSCCPMIKCPALNELHASYSLIDHKVLHDCFADSSNLFKVYLNGCCNLKELEIESQSVTILELAASVNLRSIKLMCPALKKIDLRLTFISNIDSSGCPKLEETLMEALPSIETHIESQ